MQTIARDFKVVIPVSYYERVGETTFNTVAVIDADGTIMGQYRKTHIPDDHSIRKSSILRPEIPDSRSGIRLMRKSRRYLLGPVVPGVRGVGMALCENIPAYIAGIVVGAVVTAVLVIFIRSNMMSKGKLTVDSND